MSAIAAGRYQVGDKLPTDSELTEQFNFSRTSVREGLASLVQEGLIERRRGSGTYVVGMSPSTRSRKLLAVMVKCVYDQWGTMARIVRAIEDQADEDGYSLILCNHDGQPEKAFQYAERFTREGVAGVMFNPIITENFAEANLDVIRRLDHAGIPLVLIGSPISAQTQTRYSFVGSNGFTAMQQLTRHLIHLGHRRLAYLHTLPNILSVHERLNGFLEAANEAGIEVPPDYVRQVKSSDSELQGRQEIRELLALPKPPTAVVCVYDLLARNAILELQRLGRRVPEDMAVVGFDDLPFAKSFTPPLTTVRTPMGEEGRRCVQLLRKKVETRTNEVEQIYIDCELKIRQSCGAPKDMRTCDEDFSLDEIAKVKTVQRESL